ncbi:hypothetical protein JAAARDRAFT_55330 [Jaapia argillacea MUCL 33604]|uniref:25S rRNA adenine-N(1) methyltransferase n=1 Tax=Jaapia argillacea MUCL 33604 TaxID=933084 RepID=A0A067QAR8_9AGAM|nr:hypothetical protein JAAARDRAFT_55330 [Jaapia argillacea MUCL 33604]
MPKGRRRKNPITTNTEVTSSNPHSSRNIIRQFHCLLKRRAQLQKQQDTPHNVQALADVEREMEELGGLKVYQRMSTIGQGNDRGGGTEKVLIGWLKELGFPRNNTSKEDCHKLRLLEVGALKPDNYRSCRAWIDVTPIDLRSRHPAILEQDFLLMDEAQHRGKWDVISLSLVVNFVPDEKDRGSMLCLAHSMLSEDGLLFLALPLPCVLNSRYLTFDHLKGLMGVVGFTLLKERWKTGGKMAYWIYRKTSSDLDRVPFQKKVVLSQGNRNNFSILL